MDGHDFLDTARENKVWEKAKSTFKRERRRVDDLLKVACVQIVKSHIGQP
jgi:Hypothetical protein (DUF2513)